MDPQKSKDKKKTSKNDNVKYVKLGIKRGLDSSDPASTESVRHLSRSLVRRGEAAPAARLRCVVVGTHAFFNDGDPIPVGWTSFLSYFSIFVRG